MIYLLFAYILLRDILGAINNRRIYNEMEKTNKEIAEDNKKWKEEVRTLLTK